MSGWIGDFRTGKTIRKMFSTTAVAGESITIATNGTVQVYKDGGTTQSTTGVTFTEDFDSLTGLHLVAIDTSADGTFYSAGSDFEVVLAGATIDGKSINTTLFSFSLQNRSALMPTTDGRTLDVSAGGEAGVDWANVGSPTTTLNLSGTTVGTVSALAANSITASVVAADAIGSSELATSAVDEIAAAVNRYVESFGVTDSLYDLAQRAGTGFTTLNNKIGGFTGTGVNTILGFFRALMRKDGGITTPSDVGGNYDHTTDSNEAQRDNIGTASNLGGGATIAANLSDIEAQTDDIGVAGAGLTGLVSLIFAEDVAGNDYTAGTFGQMAQDIGSGGAGLVSIPWNPAWDAEVQSEATDALNAYDPPTDAEMDAAIASIVALIGAPSDLGSGATLAFNLSDISGDLGGGGASAADVWDLADGIETGITPRQAMRLFVAFLTGVSDITTGDKTSGTITFKRRDGSTTALTLIYANGERTSSTLGTLS